MRPIAFLVTLVTCIFAFLLLLTIGPWHTQDDEDIEIETELPVRSEGGIGAYFNWRTPSSLFPPSAIISLTDDNSTFFLARPAAFGPLLPSRSLSGQLWIGSGFGDEHWGQNQGQGGYGAGVEGELGCSDVPGWTDSPYRWPSSAREGNVVAVDNLGRRSLLSDEAEEETVQPSEDDGTDDHLHHPLVASDASHTDADSSGKPNKPKHADIQSIQESAEIEGKIVLLSRGGCGFLEKVKWVQRRGGVALIVGDYVAGPLVTMYARGDTSNVTIPSLFTSHTTAHLLSSLIPSGGIWSDLEDATRLGMAFPERGGKSRSAKKDKDVVEKKSAATTTKARRKTAPTPEIRAKNGGKHAISDEGVMSGSDKQGSWFPSLFRGSSRESFEDSRRPPSSGKVGWILQEDFEDDQPAQGKKAKSSGTASTSKPPTPMPPRGATDGFRIGIQDWRDPDLVAAAKEPHKPSLSGSSSSAISKETAEPTSLRGGSITPGSGEYGSADTEVVNFKDEKKGRSKYVASTKLGSVDDNNDDDDEQHPRKSWLYSLFHDSPEPEILPSQKAYYKTSKSSALQAHQALALHRVPLSDTQPDHHDGLWITLTPTSMSSSPFFDTLLVLVVSPLVTLTVVYALLLLRSRIRRRRWRAPKSVVERLPVRTYQTLSSRGSSSTTSEMASPTATTPLLPAPGSQRSRIQQSRPRSWTIGGASSLPERERSVSPSPASVEEKRLAGLAEWRRRYGGKQRECVVCLDEYVDGVSRVMSLPCGHEFHAECITPWLTTRRRTCPICKGDVVRSLASTSSSLPAGSSPLEMEDEVAVQTQAVTLVNEDPTAQMPIDDDDDDGDLERGVDRDR